MRFKQVDHDVERRMTIGMILSTSFLKKIQPCIDMRYMKSEGCATLIEWVLEYYKVYKEAPQRTIEVIFEHRQSKLSEVETKWIKNLLVDLDSEASRQQFNESFLFDKCVAYFKKQKLLQSAKVVQDLVEDDRYEQAMEVWKDSIIIPKTDNLGINLFDREEAKRILNQDKEDIIKITTGITQLDELCGSLEEGWLIVIMAPMKHGKTFCMSHMAINAAMNGYSVVFISLEQELRDIAKRMWASIGSLDTTDIDKDLPFYKFNESNGRFDFVKEDINRPKFNTNTVVNTIKKFKRGAKRPKIWLKSFPMHSADADDIENFLDTLEASKGITPHVVVVDYLGIMNAPSKLATRDSEYNYNSMRLKAMAAERKIVMITGHQGTRQTLDKVTIKPSDASQEIRIIANLDVLFLLNQTEKEHNKNTMRIGVGMHRHRNFTTAKQVQILQQLSAGQFVTDSKLVNTPRPEDEDYKEIKKGLKNEE